MDAIERNWQDVQRRVRRAAESVGRDPAQITIVAVSKTRTAAEVTAALRAGVTDVGENRVQEAKSKRPEVALPARWHLIGGLQRNKAGRALQTFDVVQSVDNPRLADALQRRAAQAGRRLEVLLQINTAGATQQGGVAPPDAADLADHVVALEHLQVRGLMTIAAHVDDAEVVRSCFRRLRELATQLRHRHRGMEVLSMGMSGDFELAIQEGATLVRIGTAIFGPRAGAHSGT